MQKLKEKDVTKIARAMVKKFHAEDGFPVERRTAGLAQSVITKALARITSDEGEQARIEDAIYKGIWGGNVTKALEEIGYEVEEEGDCNGVQM